MLDVITDNLDVWTTAELPKKAGGRGRGANTKKSPHGIKKLRELILELAVRGKLVPQEPRDEPASALLEKISAEKIRLIKEKKIKKQKPLPKIESDDVPELLPEGWVTVRLGEILNVINGRAYKKHEMLQEGTPLLRVGNLFTSNEWYYSDLELEPDKYIDNGDLIYAWSASFGPFIWEGGKTIYHYHIWKLDLYDDACLDKKYLFNYLAAATEGIKASGNGIAMIHMTKDRMEKLLVAIPPLAEQHRIAAKVDQLMALCDVLEQEQTDSSEAHQTLVETLLGTLIQAKDSNEFQAAWLRIAKHFDTLFTTEQSIDQLKQTILQLAVMGKLVSQDPNDESASVLLEKITTEKSRLIKEKKIKKQKPLPEVGGDRDSFDVPKGWELIRFGRLFNLISGQHLKPDEYSDVQDEGMIPYLTGPAEFGEINPEPTRFTNEKRAVALKGDVLITCKGSGVGKLNLSNEPTAISRQLMAIQPILVPSDYVHLIAESIEASIRENIVGIAIPGISREDVTEAIAFLPPLAEQHRIVAKVDELMVICDSLKERLQEAQMIQVQLADTIVAKIVGHQQNETIESKTEGIIMKITTILTLGEKYANQEDAILAALINTNTLEADAKDIWRVSKFDLPTFYKQLKKEINAGYINQPAQADFGN